MSVRMLRRGLAVLAVLAVLAAPLQAQPPSNAELEAAIATGVREKKPVALRLGAEAGAGGFVCGGADRTGTCGYTIELQGPLGRVQSAAADAAKRYQPFTLAAVTDSLRAPVLLVRATPAAPTVRGGRELRAAPATHIVLIPIVGRRPDEAAAVQPSTTATFRVEWSNLLGGERAGQGVVATFPLESVPPGEFFVVVVTEGAEARYQIQAKHRAVIR